MNVLGGVTSGVCEDNFTKAHGKHMHLFDDKYLVSISEGNAESRKMSSHLFFKNYSCFKINFYKISVKGKVFDTRIIKIESCVSFF